MLVFTALSPLHCFIIVITVDLSVSMMIHWWCNSYFVLIGVGVSCRLSYSIGY